MNERTRRATSALKTRTWWNELRRQKDIKLEEVGEKTGYSAGMVSHFFSGRYMPPDDFIEKVCEMFEVEPFEGNLHFSAAYNNRQAQFREQAKEKANDDLFRCVYGIVDYDTFTALQSSTPGSAQDALDQLYGKISLEDFLKIKDRIENDGGANHE